MASLTTRQISSGPVTPHSSSRARIISFLIGVLTIVCATGHATVFVSKAGLDSANGHTWGTAKATVQAGVNAAAPGEEIWVAEGIYTETVTLPAGVALYGGFAGTETERGQRNWTTHVTVLDANYAGTAVTVNGSQDTPTVVDGFTIRNASSASGSGGQPDNVGAGIVCASGNVVISDNNISGNSGYSVGGGIDCQAGDVTITGNNISGNSSGLGGGVHCANATVTLSANAIRDNVGDYDGSGVYCDSGVVTLEGNTITGNGGEDGLGGPGGGAGVHCEGTSNVTLRRNIISYNFYNGVECEDSAIATLLSNVMTGNTDYAALVYGSADGSGPKLYLVNNTLTGNNGAIYGIGGGITVTNTLIAFNGTGIYNSGSVPATLTLSHNDVYGNHDDFYGVTDPTGTNGNVSADPQLSSVFTRPRLQPGSPCIDVGDDGAVTAGGTDIDGQPRIRGARVDIGADESDGTQWPAGGRTLHVAPGGNDNANGLTWGTSKKTIAAALAVASGDDELWVAAGTYAEYVVVPAGISVYGGFAGSETQRDRRDWATHKTVLDGKGIRRVVWARGQRILVDGFTIQNGVASMGDAGGGVLADGAVTLANNVVSNNQARPLTRGGGQGGGIFASGVTTLINNVITQNSGTNGGAICAYGPLTMLGNTISNNAAGGSIDVSGVIESYSPVTMVNNIITFNNMGVVYADLGSVVTHNDAFGNAGWPGLPASGGNLAVDPLVIQNIGPGPDNVWGTDDDLRGDFHLAANSPLRDAGEDSVVQPGERDLDGKPRILGPHVDMGAYESAARPLGLTDAATALRIAAGLSPASLGDAARLNVAQAQTTGIDLLDAAALAREASGLAANP
jgi:parallel beta-helix repeat protein